jgi:hypothetical protein
MSGDGILDGLRDARARLIRNRNRLQEGRPAISDNPTDLGILNDVVQAAVLQDAINNINLAIRSLGNTDAHRT